jgi:hypothetical protein
MVKVKALQRVYYGGREYATDEELDVSERDATTLGAIRKVMRVEATPQQAESKAKPPPEESLKSRFRRRDLKAED